MKLIFHGSNVHERRVKALVRTLLIYFQNVHNNWSSVLVMVWSITSLLTFRLEHQNNFLILSSALLGFSIPERGSPLLDPIQWRLVHKRVKELEQLLSLHSLVSFRICADDGQYISF